MEPTNFSPDWPGRVVQAIGGHWTFIPDPLPPELIFDLDLTSQLSQADLALGELAAAGRRLPNPHLLIRPFLRREAVLSSRIEGTVTQLNQLYLFEVEPDNVMIPPDAQEVLNYVAATDSGLSALQRGFPITVGLLCEMHRVLLDGVRGADLNPGQLRNRGVFIGREGQTYETARFVPPCHTEVAQLLDRLIGFIREGSRLPIIVQLAIVHYQFETIHPFNDGNGRIGRLLITLLLALRQVLPQPLLYLSAFFEQHRQDYYDGLLNVSREGTWNDWIAFFARGVADQARNAVNRIENLLALRDDIRASAIESIRSAQVHVLIDELFASPILTINQLVDATEISDKNARRIVQKLVELGILREITGQERNRVYCCDEILRVLDAP